MCAQVDLYSLGVVAFELWHPFSTAMERAVVLRELVEKGAMPPGWAEAHPMVRPARLPCAHLISPLQLYDLCCTLAQRE